jgi:hypothetical protein
MSLIQRADGQPGTPIARLRRRGETLLRDPLSEVTRKERRTLLGASTLAILVVEGRLVPEKSPRCVVRAAGGKYLAGLDP